MAETNSTSASGDTPERSDLLYCLTVYQEGKANRSFFKDTPWRGISTYLPGSDADPDTDLGGVAVLVYEVSADVEDQTDKKPNTVKNWRQNPVEFQFGEDATRLEGRYWPTITLYSKSLIKVFDLLLDYWPYRGNNDYFRAELNDVFVVLMSCYAELKHYFNTYRSSLPEDEQSNPKLDIGNCGDEKIIEAMRPHLDFGGLDIAKNPCDEQTAYDLAVLLRLLAGMYRVKVVPILSAVFLDTTPMIQHDSLWVLYRPGTTVYVKQSAFSDGLEWLGKLGRRNKRMIGPSEDPGGDDEYSACIVARYEYEDPDEDNEDSRLKTKRIELQLWNIQFDGTAFQRIERKAIIDTFGEFRPLKDLPVVPSFLYDKFDNGILRKRLEKRGQKYLSILKEPAAIRTYNHPRSGYEGQIIIDPDAYRNYKVEDDDNWGSSPLNPPAAIGDGGAGERLGKLIDFDPDKSDVFPRLKEVLVLLPRRIEGIGLKTKRWMVFEIEYISNEAPMPVENQLDKELILVSDADKDALRTVLPRGEHSIGLTPDFVAGKGEGKIFLLYGGPGTGKTLTVECVANDTYRPLLRLTAQDVGLASDVESKLRKWFTLAAKWDAILLIDEADIFLEQRKEGDLQRNSLSTVFLRTMEYYKGVLFLTTNRPGHIDDSFISRITYPIAYPDLSPETKGKLVQKFVDRFEETGTIVFDQDATRYLKNNCDELNGRQIRNALQNAVASAETKLRAARRFTANIGREDTSDSTLVTVKLPQVRAAVERQSEFQEYLKELKGRPEKARAKNKHDYLSVPPGSPR